MQMKEMPRSRQGWEERTQEAAGSEHYAQTYPTRNLLFSFLRLSTYLSSKENALARGVPSDNVN